MIDHTRDTYANGRHRRQGHATDAAKVAEQGVDLLQLGLGRLLAGAGGARRFGHNGAGKIRDHGGMGLITDLDADHSMRVRYDFKAHTGPPA
jgi:hypothetical protein